MIIASIRMISNVNNEKITSHKKKKDRNHTEIRMNEK